MGRPSIRTEIVTGGFWWRRCCSLIRQYHRHHAPPVGWLYGVIAWRGSRIVGVATVGRPVARKICQSTMSEVTRCCTLPMSAAYGAASKIYKAAEEESRRRGRGILTYTLEEEEGASLRYAGWVVTGNSSGGDWGARARTVYRAQVLLPWEKPHATQPKTRWEPAMQVEGER